MKEDDNVYSIGKNKFLIPGEFAPFIYISNDNDREDLWALEIIGSFSWSPGKYDNAVINQFDSIFPKSKWTKLIARQFVEKYLHENISYSSPFPIEFVAGDRKVKTIDSLLLELPKERPVFVDIWASWCGPCLAAFGYSHQIDSFLINHKIERLYISLDDDKDKWMDAINKYSLGGFHILANEFLKDDLREKIYYAKQNSGIPVPHYFLVNSKNLIVLDDCYSPQNFEALKDQITKVLLK